MGSFYKFSAEIYHIFDKFILQVQPEDQIVVFWKFLESEPVIKAQMETLTVSGRQAVYMDVYVDMYD